MYIIQKNININQKSLTVFEIIIHNKYISEDIFLNFSVFQTYIIWKINNIFSFLFLVFL